MPRRNAICLVVDGLQASALGAYGNTWHRTPGLDLLASESMVFDQAFVDCPSRLGAYRAFWRGVGTFTPDSACEAMAAFPERLGEAGVHTALLTDDEHVAESARTTAEFTEVVLLDSNLVIETVTDIEQTQFARIITAVMDHLDHIPQPFMLWIHCRGMAAPWDAPFEFRSSLCEGEDPEPSSSAEIPSGRLEADSDPDVLLDYRMRYGGQVQLLDACVGALHAQLAEVGLLDHTLFALTSGRGFPLGEHALLGLDAVALHNEWTQVPMMIRLPRDVGAFQRSQALIQPADLCHTMLSWWDIETQSRVGGGVNLLPVISSNAQLHRDYLCFASGGTDKEATSEHLAIRTPAWLLTTSPDAEMLFAKPDDRFEANDVASVCPVIIEAMRAALEAHIGACQRESGRPLPPLPAELIAPDR